MILLLIFNRGIIQIEELKWHLFMAFILLIKCIINACFLKDAIFIRRNKFNMH